VPGFETLLPRPSRVDATGGLLPLTENTTLDGDPAAVTWLREVLVAATGLPLRPSADPTIRFRIVPWLSGHLIRVFPDGVLVEAQDEESAFHAAQSLRQLLGPAAFRRAPIGPADWALPCGVVEDRPRFAWRGALLDVARHFMPKDGLLRFIDLLAAHKLNRLHLHLTDDQGWRFEVKRYPRLTEVGGWREGSRVGVRTDDVTDGRPHGGFYTQDDLREVVAYAARRHVVVVPEIDIPGHSQAAIAAYPELGNLDYPLPVWPLWGVNENVLNTDDSTVDFYRHVFDELVDVFPSEVICVGGDEVPTVQWTTEQAAKRGLATVPELHGWFVRQIAEHLGTHGRRAMGWDEIAEVGPLPGGAVIASWRGERAGVDAARAGFDVVMCPEQKVYLDHRESDRRDEPIPVGAVHTVSDVYEYDPIPDDLTGDAVRRVLGAQANVWTEHLDSPRRVDYAAFPRLSAFAEVVWTERSNRDLADFTRRLGEEHLPRLDALGVEYRPLAGPHPWQTRPGVPGRPR
jgi:hexosaminidase